MTAFHQSPSSFFDLLLINIQHIFEFSEKRIVEFERLIGVICSHSRKFLRKNVCSCDSVARLEHWRDEGEEREGVPRQLARLGSAFIGS